jgi:hypothetical protein
LLFADDWERVSWNSVQGLLGEHHVQASDPLPDITVSCSANRIEIGPGSIEVIAREDDSLSREPDIELVRGFPGGGYHFQFAARVIFVRPSENVTVGSTGPPAKTFLPFGG